MALIVKFLLLVVSTAVFLLLAIIGWGGFAAYFANSARIGVVVVTLALAVLAFFVGGSLSPGIREDRSNRWVLTAFGVLSILGGWFCAYTDRMEIGTIDGDAVRWLGVVLLAVGGVVRLVPVYLLGHRFSGLVAIQPNHELLTTGLYSRIRHPSYLGLVLSAAGWALAFRSGPGLLLAAVNLVPLVARMNAEERLLLSQFGPDYEAYRARTSRLIPGLY